MSDICQCPFHAKREHREFITATQIKCREHLLHSKELAKQRSNIIYKLGQLEIRFLGLIETPEKTTLKQVSATLHIRHGAYVNHLHTYERILDQYKTEVNISPKN